MRALLASGSGRYADPWHPFDRTSAAVAAILESAGFVTEVDDDLDGALARLDGVELLVVNAGDPWRDGQEGATPDSAIAGLAAALDRGIGVLALHCAVASLRDHADWAPAIGAVWIPDASFHPPIGPTTISGGALPDGRVVEGFDVFDERYCRLQRIGSSHVIATHEHAGVVEPTAWVREHGSSRIAVDVLGHDERSYGSAGHVELVTRLAGWAAGR